MKRFFARVALTGVIASSAWLMTSAPAQAGFTRSGDGRTGNTCYGKYVKGENIYRGSKSVAAVFLYYSPANGGTYCAFTRNYVRDGYARFMSVEIRSTNGFAKDTGAYHSYAGTVSVVRAANRCVTVVGRYDLSNYVTLRDNCGRTGPDNREVPPPTRPFPEP